METTLENIKMEQYPSYKDSGVKWLGEIPTNWKSKKLKFFGSTFAGLTGKKGDDFSKEYIEGMKPFIPFTNICNNRIISDEQYQYVKVKESEVQNRVKKNDILFLMSSETLEDIARCSIYLGDNSELYLNSFCKGFRLNTRDLNPEYVNYLLFCTSYRNYFSLVGRGFTRINLKQEYINDAIILIPPLPEQTRIATFLDQKTAQIDQAIAQKERLIELLKERRQILIHNAVTRGLDPNVRMKESGVDWIGEVPEHWEVRRLKVFSTVQSGITLGKTYTGNKIASFPYLRVANVQAGYLDLSVIAEIQIPLSDVPKYLVRKGDILVTEGGDIDKLGRGTIWQGEIENCLHQNHIFAIRVDLSIALSEFIEICLGADYGRKYFTNTANKTTNLASTNSTKLGNFPVAMPTLSEQYDIVNYVAHLNKKIGAAIACKQSEIEKLKEYKATLINSVVTGKIKV